MKFSAVPLVACGRRITSASILHVRTRCYHENKNESVFNDLPDLYIYLHFSMSTYVRSYSYWNYRERKEEKSPSHQYSGTLQWFGDVLQPQDSHKIDWGEERDGDAHF